MSERILCDETMLAIVSERIFCDETVLAMVSERIFCDETVLAMVSERIFCDEAEVVAESVHHISNIWESNKKLVLSTSPWYYCDLLFDSQ